MDAKKFEDGEEATLKTERKSLRLFISSCHAERVGDAVLDINVVKSQFRRLCEIHRLIIGNALATGKGDTDKESEDNAKYVTKVEEIIAHYSPKIARAKAVEIKLPKVQEDDPASWLSFKTML